MANRYKIFNGPAPTTAAQAPVTTGTAIKTMLQVKLNSGVQGTIIEWGISFDGSAAATPGKCELLTTGTVFATVTAFSSGDITKFGDPNHPAADTAYFSLGTSASGYTSSAEGTITTTEMFDAQLLPPTQPYIYQFPLGYQPVLNAGDALRIRVTFAAAINAICYILMEV